MTPILLWNIKWLFVRFTFFHRTTVTLDTQWQNARTFLDMPVTFWISRGLLLIPGLSSWLHMRSFTREIFCCIRIDRGRPLPTFRSTEPVLSIFRKRSLTELTDHFFCWNSEQIHLAPHPFSCLRHLVHCNDCIALHPTPVQHVGNRHTSLMNPFETLSTLYSIASHARATCWK